MKKLHEYNEIKNAICNSFSHNIVDGKEDTISVFEAIKLINAYIYPLIEVRNNNDIYVENMNNLIRLELFNKKYSKSFASYIKTFSIDRLDLMPGIQGFFANVYLHRKRGLKKSHYYEAVVMKNDDNKMSIQSITPYYTSNNSEIEFCISSCEEYLNTIVSFADEYMPFLNQVSKMSNIKTDLFDISLNYTTKGIMAKIRPNESTIDLQAFYANNGKKRPLEQIVEENKDLILWCTPISKDLLPKELKGNIEKTRVK